MTKYKRIDTKNGRTQYWVDGKMKSKNLVPTSVLEILEPGVELEVGGEPTEQTTPPTQEAPKEQPSATECYFGDAPKTHVRFLNGMDIYVCDDHYALTLGKLAQAIREKNKTTESS